MGTGLGPDRPPKTHTFRSTRQFSSLRFLFRLTVLFLTLFGAHAGQTGSHEEAIHGYSDLSLSGHWVVGSLGSSPQGTSQTNLHDCAFRLTEGETFARFYQLSAAPTGDCDIGSGWISSWSDLHTMDRRNGFTTAGAHRYGEALHPGPLLSGLLSVSVSNPTGIRRKEKHMLEQGVGIHHYAETHLTSITSRSSIGILKTLARQHHREVRCVTGADVKVRTNSQWAGAWSGVAMMADFPTTRLNVQWPPEHWASSRLLMSRSWIGNVPVTSCTFYGYSSGPTWPKARALSDELLTTVTRELIYGCGGVRMVAGDFNCSPGALGQQRAWMEMGWKSAQQAALEMFGTPVSPTCHQSTEPDQLWLSPEALMLLREVSIEENYVGHSTVVAKFEMPTGVQMVHRWPQPSKIPWEELNGFRDEQLQLELEDNANPTERYRRWANTFEAAVDNYSKKMTKEGLPPRCMGRAVRLQPKTTLQVAPSLKASRHGEIVMKNDLVGTAVRQWFFSSTASTKYVSCIEGRQSFSSCS